MHHATILPARLPEVRWVACWLRIGPVTFLVTPADCSQPHAVILRQRHMSRCLFRFLGVLVLASCALGCMSSMTRGVRSYNDGDHTKAMEHFLDAEGQVPGEDSEVGARYALYRGLTHLSLGDWESAERWLAEAKSMLDVDPHVLGHDDKGRLLAAWVSIGHEIGTWGRLVLQRR